MMIKPTTRLTLALLTLMTMLLGSSGLVRAQGPVTLTITVESAYFRNGPSLSALRVHSVFQGAVFPVIGRSADNTWLQLGFSSATPTWVLARLGQVNGDLGSVPVTADIPAAVPALSTLPNSAAPASNETAGSITSARLTITVASAWARNAPGFGTLRVASLFQGQTYTAIGRTSGADWIQIIYGSSPVWVLARMGKLNQNSLNLPIVEGASSSAPVVPVGPINSLPVPVTNTTRPPLPPWIPVISQHMRQVYKQSSQYGNSVNAFATVGDCNSEPFVYLERLAGGLFDLQPYGYLVATKNRFYPSFLRNSVAVQGSFGAASMFEPIWSDPKQCRSDEGPFACELRVTRASIVFISLGTGDHLVWQGFEANYRKLIEYALKRSVLPVLVTKADTLESLESDAPAYYINSVIRRLGQEYDVPVLDLELATKDLPNHGLVEEGGHDFHQSALAMDVHILTTLQTLDVIWR